jgi:NAD(P)-dependent dehydrogenase (short-subunit alcohol dehydrogenase family)
MAGLLDERRTLVTGGGAGIGLAIARAFAREGAAIAIVDLDAGRAEAAAAELAAGGNRTLGLAANVADERQVAAAVSEAAAALGGLDVVVNNAGIAAFGRVDTTDLATWERVMAVNVTGTFLVSRAAIPFLLASGRGSIINLGSVAGLVGIPGMAAYCAAKGAIVNLTRQMAADFSGLGIRVNAICPGTVAATDLGRSLLGSDTSPDAQARRLAKYPIGRFGEPEEIAEAALFLASDRASFVSGAIMAVDGGMTAI